MKLSVADDYRLLRHIVLYTNFRSFTVKQSEHTVGLVKATSLPALKDGSSEYIGITWPWFALQQVS